MVLVELRIRDLGHIAVIAALVSCPSISRADEGGVSFWLPGQYASFAAAPQVPGWALGVVYYHSNVSAFGSVAASKEILAGRIPPTVNVNLNLSLAGQADLIVLAPTYTFAQSVLGGQLSVGVSSWFGRSAASIAGTLTASVGSVFATRTGMLEDALTSYGDIVPIATLRWNSGVNNFMTYVTGDVPVGDYNPARLANLGIGHGTIDAGGAYTYLNPATGNEFSAIAGFTYNFKNPTRNTATASIFTSTGGPRISSPSSFSSALPDMPINRSPTTPVKTRFWAASGRAFSALVRRLDTISRWAACRDSWV
jgi:hypothetical protein